MSNSSAPTDNSTPSTASTRSGNRSWTCPFFRTTPSPSRERFSDRPRSHRVIQLTVLNGKKAGAEQVTRRFPFRIGRAPECDLCLDDDGVWDRHLELNLRSDAGIHLAAQPQALTAVNGQPVLETPLRNGDLIEMGSLRLRFWLAPTRQRGLRLRESLTWLFLALLSLGQVAVIYWLVM